MSFNSYWIKDDQMRNDHQDFSRIFVASISTKSKLSNNLSKIKTTAHFIK